MRRATIIQLGLPILWTLTTVTCAWSQGSTAVHYRQTFMDGSAGIDSQIASSPAPFALIDGESTDTSIYTLESTYVLDALKLGTTAFISVSGTTGDTPSNWETIAATATATSELSEFVTVQGLNMPAGQTGTVEFNWSLTGNTEFILRDVNNTNVTNFTSIAYLQANVPGAGGFPFSETRSLSTNTTVHQNFPAAGEIYSYAVPFEAGTELLVDFTLFSQVSFAAEVVNTSAIGPGGGEVFALLASHYGNTAVLDSAVVKDGSGVIQPNAMLTGTMMGTPWMCNASGCATAVPEPGSFLMLGLVASVAAGVKLIRRRCHIS